MNADSEFLTTVNLLPEPTLLVDTGGTIRAGNTAALRYLRAPPAGLSGLELSRFVADPPRAVTDYLCRCARSAHFLPGAMSLCVNGGAPIRSRTFGARYGARCSGAERLVLMRMAPVHPGSSGFFALNEKIRELNHEVTRRRRVEVELRRSEQALRDADRRKDEFLATLAHELRNPLAPVRNAIRLMAAYRDDPSRLAALREMTERQLNHMVRLIDDLMDVSRITQGRLELRPERAPLNAVLDIAIETSRPLLESKSQELRIERAPEELLIDADVTRLAQVFSNLLNNSAKYSPARSVVCIATRREGDRAVVSVSDQGVGIPVEMLDGIFDMFVQVPNRPREGLGIGLTLVKRTVELHRGTVTASSAGEGQGSTFIVRLPLSAETAAAAAPESAYPPQDRRVRARILVADDNADAAETLALLLELAGHEVRVAGDGVEALAVAEQFRPQIALLDIGMPRLDGYETARRLRDRPWGRSTRLIAITGWGQDQDRRRAIDAGFDRHLVKPVDPQLLPPLLEELLQPERGGAPLCA